MNEHLEKLEKLLGPMNDKRILDIGAGFGDFLLACGEKGFVAVGVERSEKRVSDVKRRAAGAGIQINISQGLAESIPFGDGTFDFINASELVEHVDSPDRVLAEVRRLLKPGGACYMSVHNRFGFHEKHYRMRGLNWMPRPIAEKILNVLGKQKHSDGSAGLQKLSDMHYYTYSTFEELCRRRKLLVIDTRQERVTRRYGGLLSVGYRLLRPWYFSTFHTFLVREEDVTAALKIISTRP